MKKHLIAAAVAAAVAVPAMAQVTVSGRIDLGVVSNNTGSATNVFTQNNQFTTSRLTFAGAEDLGGGLKAGFKLESSLLTDEGRLGAITTSADRNQIFDRDAFVSLSGGFGEIRLGLIESESNKVHAGMDAMGANYSYASISSTVAGRLASAVSYTTPSISGFKGLITRKNAEVSTNIGEATEYSVNYAAGALSAMVASYNEKLTASSAKKGMSVGAKYNLGMALVGVSLADINLNTAADSKLKASTLSVALPMGATTIGASVGRYDGSTANADSNFYSVSARYNLSKRTFGYGFFASMNNGSAGARNTNGGPSATGTASAIAADTGKNASSFGAGIAHSF